MKTSSLYDVQKKAEEGGAQTPQSRPPRPNKSCLCTLIVLSVLIVLSLAVVLTLLMTGPDWLRLNLSGNSKWTKVGSRTGAPKPGADSSREGKAEQETTNTDDATLTTTESPPSSVIAIPTSKPPTTKLWFKEVIFFKPRPAMSDPSGATKASTGEAVKPSDTNTNRSPSLPTPGAGAPTQTKSSVVPGVKKVDQEQQIKPVTTKQMFSRFWPDVRKMLSDAASKTLPYLSIFFPPGQGTKAGQTSSSKGPEKLDKTTLAPSYEGAEQASPAPTAANSVTTNATPEDQAPGDKPPAEKTAQQAATSHGLRVRRVPSWIYSGGSGLEPGSYVRSYGRASSSGSGGPGSGSYVRSYGRASSSGGDGPGSGSYVRSYSRARNGATRSWTVKDEARNGVKTHSASDTGTVRLPEQRTSHRTHLVYDGASGTWRRDALPDTSATWTPPTVPTMKPWVFKSPAASGSWGVFGTPGSSQTPSSDGGATSADVFAAARRRMEAARRRIQQYHQNMGGFTGYTSWDH